MYKLVTSAISIEDYQTLRSHTSWKMYDDSFVEKALKNDLFSVKVFAAEQIVAVARVIGDGAIYFYIQDVIVHPDHRNKGIAKLMMNEIEKYLKDVAAPNAFIGLMAAEGVSEFYEKFGYMKRNEEAPGMFKIILKD